MSNQNQFTREDIDTNMGTVFSLISDSGDLDVSGNILDPESLRKLADTLEKLYSGQIQTHDVIGFDLD